MSTPNAPLAGRIAYGDFQFGSPELASPSYRLTGAPVYNAEGQATHVRYLLQVCAMLPSEGNTASHSLTTARQRLSQPHLPLELVDFSSLSQSAGDNFAAEAWEVTPQKVELTPLAGTSAWQLEWHCAFNLPAVAASENAPVVSAEVAWTADERGFFTRTIHGCVQWTAHSAPSQTQRDAWRTRLRFPVPANFRRVRSRWQPRPAAHRLEFELVDEESRRLPFPPGIVDGELDFRLDQAGGMRSSATLEGWLESAPHASPAIAWQRFWQVARGRIRGLQQALGGALVVPVRLEVTQRLFTRRTQFRLELFSVRAAADWLLDANLWSPVDESHALWQTDLSDAATREAHFSRVVLRLAEQPLATSAALGRGDSSDDNVGDRAASAWIKETLWPAVRPELSYLAYEARVRLHRREQATVHTLATDLQRATTASPDGFGPAFRALDGQPSQSLEWHGAPLQRIVLTGRSLRLRYSPVAPSLTTYGGRPVTELERHEERELVTHCCGQPVFGLRWSIAYAALAHLPRTEFPTAIPQEG